MHKSFCRLQIAWYNELVDEPFRLKYEKDTLAVLVLSLPQMFEQTFIPFIQHEMNGRRDSEGNMMIPETSDAASKLALKRGDDTRIAKSFLRDPLDECMKQYFDHLIRVCIIISSLFDSLMQELSFHISQYITFLFIFLV